MPDLSSHGFSLIPGPSEIPEPFFSTEMSFLTEYPIEDVAEAFDALFVPLPAEDDFDVASRSWEWREGERFIRLSISSMVSEEGSEVWAGSELELSCTPEDLLRLWKAVRERLGAVWLHDASCRMYRPETFLDALREARGPATAESIFSAVREGRSWDLQSLLQEDRQLARAVDSSGRSPLHSAFMSRDMLELLLAAGADVHALDSTGSTPLLLAARWGRADAVACLLAAGAGPNAADDEGRTPLHWAVQRGSVEVVRLLLSHGADPHLADRHGNTAQRLASSAGRSDLLALLSQ